MNATNNQRCTLANVYANNTIWFTYSGCEISQATFTYTVLSYGNGTLTLRFAGAVPYAITQSATTSAYSTNAGWQQLTYTANQNSPLVILFTNPRLSLTNGALIAAIFLVALVVIRTVFAVLAPTSTARYAILVLNRKIFLAMCLIVFLIFLLALLFP